jgi:hypothetical protein
LTIALEDNARKVSVPAHRARGQAELSLSEHTTVAANIFDARCC